MARKKLTNYHPVGSLKAANEALEKIAELKRLAEAEIMVMNDEIDGIKAQTESSVEKLHQQIQLYENGLQLFSECRKDELFKKRRSIDLLFGTFGFRKSTKLVTTARTKWARVVELLEEKGLKSGIRIKKSANKDVLGEWSDEKLAQVNVKRKEDDVFWYEVNEEELPEPEGHG